MPPALRTVAAFAASLVLAMGLHVLPLPAPWSYYNPDWILLILAAWHLALPARLGVFTAWCVGLLADALTARALGQHALGYAVAIYTVELLNPADRKTGLPRQTLSIFVAALLAELLVFWTQNLRMVQPAALDHWLSALTTAICWAPLRAVVRLLYPPLDDTD